MEDSNKTPTFPTFEQLIEFFGHFFLRQFMSEKTEKEGVGFVVYMNEILILYFSKCREESLLIDLKLFTS
ncbi:MAG: hypothetical protein DWQ06_02335 [Calditrichaeota bacterium]|nr:MAG: hypothetical protein DWQ06_02335 [Calditrichota bacterium]